MMMEICFLNEAGRLSCFFASGFTNVDHVTGYVRGVLQTATMREKILSAEIYAEAFPSPLVIRRHVATRGKGRHPLYGGAARELKGHSPEAVHPVA